MNSHSIPLIRTLGDGMENNAPKRAEFKIGGATLTIPSDSILKSMRPVKPTSKVYHLVPKYVPQDKKVSLNSSKPKEPKFVPYEPYKAAVQPIRALNSKKMNALANGTSKNNIEIQDLVQQMSDMRTKEMDKLTLTALPNDELIFRTQWKKEKEVYESDIKNLQETKAHLENQLKFQAQVNSELKTLLVAAVGEDLETRVQHLTEDKLSLARALLNSATHLTSHQEQTEWLSGQCEVWRSKFLASSLMVEELARWKSALTKRTNDLQEVIKKMLSENRNLQKHSLRTFESLSKVIEKETGKVFKLKSGDLVELTSLNQEISAEIAEISKIDCMRELTRVYGGSFSCVEKHAIKILKNAVSLSSQDILCSALVGAAHSMTGETKYSKNQFLHPCCAHCKGEVQHI